MTRGISLKGVVIGGIADVVGTNLVLLPVMIVAAAPMHLDQLPADQRTTALVAAMQTPTLYTVGLVLGSLCSIGGGYLAARIAKRREILNGALSAFLCVAMGVAGMRSGTNPTSPWLHAVFFVLSPALGALGGYWRSRQRPSAPASTADADAEAAAA